MCTTLPSSISSSLGNNLKEYNENIDDSTLYFENISDKEKEEAYFRDISSDSHEIVIEKSKNERFAKVNNFSFNIIIIKFLYSLMIYLVLAPLKKYIKDMIMI